MAVNGHFRFYLAQDKKIDLKDFEDKFGYDGEFEAPALEHKVPIEKQKLVIDA